MADFKPAEDFAKKLDQKDPLKSHRNKFYIPDCIYMDGNSLGLLSKNSETSLLRVIEEWKTLAISGWLKGKQPWFYFAENLGKIASELVGAEPEEVIATGTTTVNIHSLISTFFNPVAGKNKILADELNFPSDIYALKSQLKLFGLNPQKHLILVRSRDGNTLSEKTILKHMTNEIALAFLPSVLYKSGQLLDMALLSEHAHKKNILIGFDCSHSVGGIPHYFKKWGVDFATWCSYKYLNGGPGSSAFLFINKKHFKREPMLAGWFGYKKEKQFDMSLKFQHQETAGGWQISSPGILGCSALEGSLLEIKKAGIQSIRNKSIKMTSYFIYLIDTFLTESPYNLSLITPRNPEQRGGHIAVERKDYAWQICEALRAKKVVPDFRPPNIIRFAPIALYNTYHEIWTVVQHLKKIIDKKEYKNCSKKRKAIS